MASQKTPGVRQRDPKATVTRDSKASIIRAAVDVFARKGYEAASVREIAEAAGITKPTLYYYFGSKEGLGGAILREAQETLEASLTVSTRGPEEAFERLVDFVDAHFEACKANQSLARFLYSLSFAPQESEAKFDLNEIHAWTMQRAAKEMELAVGQGLVRKEVCQEAALLLTGIINIHLMAFLNHLVELNRERAELAVRLFLEGAGTDRREPGSPESGQTERSVRGG